MRGLFISMEGPDGSGKTTQIEKLKEYFSNKGYEVVITREPGGTQISEEIRNIILDVKNEALSDMTEALLCSIQSTACGRKINRHWKAERLSSAIDL